MSAIVPLDQTIDEKSPLAPEAAPAAAPESEDWRARLDRVLRTHGRRIHWRAQYLAGKQGADDLVQETLCKLVSAYGRDLSPRTPPATDDHMVRLIFTAMRNASIDAHDAWLNESAVIVASATEVLDADETDNETPLELDSEPFDEGSAAPVNRELTDFEQAAIAAAAAKVDAEELTDLLDDALSTLPPMQDQVVVFRGWLGDSREEVAELLDISVRTVDAHLQAGYASLRDYLLDEAPWLGNERLAGMILQLAMRHAVKSDARRVRRECRELMAA